MTKNFMLFFLVQKCFQLLRCKKQIVPERWQQRFLPISETYNGGISLQPVQAIDKLAGDCSRKFWQRGKICFSADINFIQRHGDQLKLAEKVVDVVDCPYWKICVTLLKYYVGES